MHALAIDVRGNLRIEVHQIEILDAWRLPGILPSDRRNTRRKTA